MNNIHVDIKKCIWIFLTGMTSGKWQKYFSSKNNAKKPTEIKVDESASEFLEMYPELHSKHRTVNW